MKTVVITGASTGIGRTTAERLAAKGWKVFAGVRKQEDADTLKKADPAIEPLMLDVTKAEDIEAAIAKVSDTLGGAKLAGLVNNAGIASMGPLALQPADEFKAHFEVNVFGTLSATQGFLPLLGMDRNRTGDPGRIVNITSLGGRIAAPFLGAYTATKHAVESMTDSFRRELVIYGIDAIAIGPGSVKTPIWDKAEDKNEDQPYANSAWAEPIRKFSETMLKGGREGLPPERVAEIIETALTDSSPKARYAPVPDKFTNWTIPTHIPKRWLDSIFANRFGMERPD
ncbi:MAG: short-chain dehydrogenase [Henriciella sp.]|jgi:NAD(P)-dependent dehydrogenase (short-subunit alcohol dehydrogenase family)|uniref:SDR family oxidoreductase n=1 Tax=Henriciella sp. TaxID=1968823 RepID=UPI000C0E34B0|nr:SDR family oxidoreductase [Henriciella sp.]MBF33807.1 short-chain dehydrogenase [Hyphomonadaceae bacterium]MBK74433.1 short-chain dehydrogenase [Henriciella sp.]PHR76045.1 MAG: short-chain dehydrogenase [Henriciella sp.]|tara:strand:- start:4590 stop:5444 length:855 start_codon:yes stop_codon:yes gene_type:complete